jgi:NADPH:quinone reductase-like Zn-dependent oxidoreductase
VHEVGEGVTHVKKGDRVLGYVLTALLIYFRIVSKTEILIRHAFSLVSNDPSHGGFQLYTACNALVVAKIPADIDFNAASVLPLAISTAAACLFKKETLALSMPDVSKRSSSGKSVLVWGGSSSVGATAIQLAAGAGHKVVSVASQHNVDKLKDLGAVAAFDYKSPSVVDDIIAALEGTEFAGVCDAIGSSDSAAAWAPVHKKLGGRYGSVMPGAQGLPEGIEGSSVFAPSVALDDRYIGDEVWAKWVPVALESGALKALPGPIVIKGGLDSVQKGYDEQKKGVSFGKIVIEL